jgi:SNF2 family DNA or RNA helicase
MGGKSSKSNINMEQDHILPNINQYVEEVIFNSPPTLDQSQFPQNNSMLIDVIPQQYNTNQFSSINATFIPLEPLPTQQIITNTQTTTQEPNALLNHNSPRAEQPKDALLQLKPHQLAMLYKCQQIEKNSKFGALTSKPGSGKTITLLSLILLDKNSRNIIVVPQNIYHQWIREIKKFCPSYITYVKYIDYADITGLYFTLFLTNNGTP